MTVSRRDGYVKKVRGCSYRRFGTVLDNNGTQVSPSVSDFIEKKILKIRLHLNYFIYFKKQIPLWVLILYVEFWQFSGVLVTKLLHIQNCSGS